MENVRVTNSENKIIKRFHIDRTTLLTFLVCGVLIAQAVPYVTGVVDDMYKNTSGAKLEELKKGLTNQTTISYSAEETTNLMVKLNSHSDVRACALAMFIVEHLNADGELVLNERQTVIFKMLIDPSSINLKDFKIANNEDY